METLIIASLKAVRSMFAPGMVSLLVKLVLLTIVLLFLFTSVTSGLLLWAAGHFGASAPLAFMSLLGVVGVHVLSWFLFPGIMPVIVSFFDNRIAHIIEQEDYPASLPAQSPRFWPEFWHDVRFSLMTLLLNLLVLPLYLLLHVFGPILFYWMNGYLLGREFFVMVGRRHQPIAQAEALRRTHSRSVLAAGVLLALLATIPIANLFAPFWGIAVMTHLYHRLAKTPPSQLLPPV